MSDQKSDLLKLSGMWLSEAKSGTKYFSGRADQKELGALSILLANNPGKNLKLLVFKNTKAEKETDPGYNLFCQIDEPREAVAKTKGQQDINDAEKPF